MLNAMELKRERKEDNHTDTLNSLEEEKEKLYG